MEKKQSDITVIRLRRRTREKLAELGKKRETYDDIICRLIENNGSD